jgi:polyhydroxyalkanoate synthesis repressor PhaR
MDCPLADRPEGISSPCSAGAWQKNVKDSPTDMRTIKRYSNRKLYDTQESHYVTLQQIAELIRGGDEIRVIDKDTQRDLTSATFAQIIFEEEKRGARVPPTGLRKIIQSGQIP